MRILILTGKLASPIALSIASKVSAETGIEIDVATLNIAVAALMTTKDVLEYLSKRSDEAKRYDLIIAPGLLLGDLDIVNRALGVRCYKGSRYIGDLPLVIEEVVKRGAQLSTSKPADAIIDSLRKGDYSRALKSLEESSRKAFNIGSISIPLDPPPFRILAEVNIENPIETTVREAGRLVESGADMLVIGTHADSNDPEGVKRVFREIRKRYFVPLGIDSLNPREVEAAVSEGAGLVMNISRSFFDLVDRFGRDLAYVLVPERVDDPTAASRVKALKEDLADLVNLYGVKKLILDPVIPPPHFGALEGLYAVMLTKREIGSYPVLMSSANIVEMIDADSIGINALLTSLALEAGASVILATEDSWKTRGSVSEIKRAAAMCSVAYVRRSPPKDLGFGLLIAKSKEKPVRIPIVFEEDIMVDRYVPPSKLDRERFFVIQADHGERYVEVYIFRGDREKAAYRVRGRDPRSVGRIALRLSGIQDPEHALYLGIELARAFEATRLGRRYEQDEQPSIDL